MKKLCTDTRKVANPLKGQSSYFSILVRLEYMINRLMGET